LDGEKLHRQATEIARGIAPDLVADERALQRTLVKVTHNRRRRLAGQILTLGFTRQAPDGIGRKVSPISDLRSTEHYRRTVTGNLPAKFRRRLAGGMGSPYH